LAKPGVILKKSAGKTKSSTSNGDGGSGGSNSSTLCLKNQPVLHIEITLTNMAQYQ